MIDGITVLSTSELVTVNIGCFIFAIIGACVFGTGLFIFAESNDFVIGSIVGIIGVLMITFTIISGNLTKTTGEYEYKVTISDEVNFVEFNNKYEIVDQDGLIYTIREKEIDNE